MLIIGITGSIGMGKTTVSKMLRILKIPVFDSDKTVKEILDKNYDIIENISKLTFSRGFVAISINHLALDVSDLTCMLTSLHPPFNFIFHISFWPIVIAL